MLLLALAGVYILVFVSAYTVAQILRTPPGGLADSIDRAVQLYRQFHERSLVKRQSSPHIGLPSFGSKTGTARRYLVARSKEPAHYGELKNGMLVRGFGISGRQLTLAESDIDNRDSTPCNKLFGFFDPLALVPQGLSDKSRNRRHVLWAAIKATLLHESNAVVVLYTCRPTKILVNSSNQNLRSRVKAYFGVTLPEAVDTRLVLIYINPSPSLPAWDDGHRSHLSIMTVVSMIHECVSALLPDVWVDVGGYSHSGLVYAFMRWFMKIPIWLYVAQEAICETQNAYEIFVRGKLFHSFVDVIFVDSTGKELAGKARANHAANANIAVVPVELPFIIDEEEASLSRSTSTIRGLDVVYIAPFTTAGLHETIITHFASFLKSHTHHPHQQPRLILYTHLSPPSVIFPTFKGRTFNYDTSLQVYSARLLLHALGLEEKVHYEFRFDCSTSEISEYLASGSARAIFTTSATSSIEINTYASLGLKAIPVEPATDTGSLPTASTNHEQTSVLDTLSLVYNMSPPDFAGLAAEGSQSALQSATTPFYEAWSAHVSLLSRLADTNGKLRKATGLYY